MNSAIAKAEADQSEQPALSAQNLQELRKIQTIAGTSTDRDVVIQGGFRMEKAGSGVKADHLVTVDLRDAQAVMLLDQEIQHAAAAGNRLVITLTGEEASDLKTGDDISRRAAAVKSAIAQANEENGAAVYLADGKGNAHKLVFQNVVRVRINAATARANNLPLQIHLNLGSRTAETVLDELGFN